MRAISTRAFRSGFRRTFLLLLLLFQKHVVRLTSVRIARRRRDDRVPLRYKMKKKNNNNYNNNECRQKLLVKTSSRRRRVKIVFVIVISGYGSVTRSSRQCCRGVAGDRHVMLYLSLLQVPLADDKIAACRSFASGRRRRSCATREPGQTTRTRRARSCAQRNGRRQTKRARVRT